MQTGRPPIEPLDRRQRAAAEAPEGPVLILGGPGTGKSHALLARVAVLLERGKSPLSIACLSCSRQGAEDLRRRLAQCDETRESSSQMFIGTFHGCALYSLRTSGAGVLGIPAHFTVRDRRQAVETLSELLSANPDLGIPPRRANRVLNWHWLDQARSRYDSVPPEASSWLEAVRLHTDEKSRQAVVDVDDLIPLAVRAMERDPQFRDSWRSMITKDILVDDFQEITEAQYEFLTLMTSTARSIAVAANPNEYAGLQPGSDPSLLERFRLDWREVNDRDDLAAREPRRRRFHLLTVNHRATGSLSQVADRMAGHQTMTGLHQDGQRPFRIAGTPPTLVRFEGRLADMYLHVLQAARQMVEEEGSAWEDLACIYRNHETFDRMRTLVLAEGMPYTVLGGGRRERGGDAGAVIAMLTLLLNPYDANSFSAAAAIDPRPGRNRLDARAVRQVCRTAREQGINLAQAAETHIAEYEHGSRTRRDLLHVTSGWRELTAMLEKPETSPNDLCQRAMALLRSARQSRSDQVVEPGMVELVVMSQTMPLYEDDTPRDRLIRLLDDLNADPDHDPLALEKSDHFAADRGMTFSTIAASAGLQWKVVFVLDASDGVMPGHVNPDDEERRHAEQRLFYVASTRASDRLFYCSAVRSGESQSAVPSRFLDTIGDDLLQVESIPGPDPL